MQTTIRQSELDVEEALRDCIADALSVLKSYKLPDVCVRIRLASGTIDEAYQSKRKYVRKRLLDCSKTTLLEIASDVLALVHDRALSDLVSELTIHGECRITEVTRRDILRLLNSLETLFGVVDLFEGLNIITTETLSYDGLDNFMVFTPTLAQEIEQHYISNPDYSNEELLIKCSALTCSQARFFALLEKLLDPVVRRGQEQSDLANALNSLLQVDGFQAIVVGEQSKHPVYAIRKMQPGVTGQPKNLVFAAIEAKPDLYFIDAINNDIAIRNETDALIYDRFLGDSCLLWSMLVEWWQAQQHLTSYKDARASLYRRLKESVMKSGSPGEYALFETYYTDFFKVLGEGLPALIPQVYLHYDPRTQKERGQYPVLLRQRMDLLLLLDHNIRIVIEVDGKHHYADGDVASPKKYGQMVAEDRRLHLLGYELYRFGGAEFDDVTVAGGNTVVGSHSKQLASQFFRQLFEKHRVLKCTETALVDAVIR